MLRRQGHNLTGHAIAESFYSGSRVVKLYLFNFRGNETVGKEGQSPTMLNRFSGIRKLVLHGFVN